MKKTLFAAIAATLFALTTPQTAHAQPTDSTSATWNNRTSAVLCKASQGIYGAAFWHTQGEPDTKLEPALNQQAEIGVYASGARLIAKGPLDAWGHFKVSVPPGQYMVSIVGRDGQTPLNLSHFQTVVKGFYVRGYITVERNRPKPAGGAYGHVVAVTPALLRRIKAKNDLSAKTLKSLLDPKNWEVWLTRIDDRSLVYDDPSGALGEQGIHGIYTGRVDARGDFKIFAPPGRYTVTLRANVGWGYILGKSAAFDVAASYCVKRNLAVAEKLQEIPSPGTTPGETGFSS